MENRSERFLEELRIRHEDEKLVYEGQIAQLLGDEEKAKEIVAEQVLCKFMIEHLDLPHSRQHQSTGHHNHHRAPKHVQYP